MLETLEKPVATGRNFSLEGRVIIVTGGGQGIGREYARQLAAAGAIPIIAEINTQNADNVVSEIEAEGGAAMSVKTDVSDPNSVESLISNVMDAYGHIDGLVNNAGIFSTLKMREFTEIPLDEWDLVMRVNITGCFLMARAVAPIMKQQNFGRIINITSGSVPLGVKNYMHYVTSKSALIGMTNSMARELGAHGITVNAVQPGGTFTEVPRETVTEDGKTWLKNMQCIPREEVPMDLVGLVLFLNTEAAGFITGQTIACDGGLTHW